MACKIYIDQLFRQYYRPMCLYALHYINDIDIVEDIVQDAFTSLWQAVQRGLAIDTPKAYLVSCVKNGCLDFIRRTVSHPLVAMPSDLCGNISDEDALMRSFEESELWKVIDSLPPGRRKMLLMHKRDGLKHKEIAKRLGVSEGTVRNQISRALKAIRGRILLGLLLFFA